MSIIDDRGRLFGRLNLIDATVLALVLVVIPIGYATYLLFRPSAPAIDSVTRVEISTEERRIASGSALTAKLKVKGSGFNPLLRAWIGESEAMGFIFENPNSADVLVGLVPAGTHDLILYDGAQVVARAAGAVTIQNTGGVSIQAAGWLTGLSPGTAASLAPGFASDPRAPAAFDIVAIGPASPARSRIAFGTGITDLPVPGQVEREAILRIRCDRPERGDGCSIAGQSLSQAPPVQVTLPGAMRFQIHEILADSAPRKAVAQVRMTGVPGTVLNVGDRDAFLGTRAAVVTSIQRDGAGATATIELGLDDSREGWRYRGQLVTIGAPFVLTTAGYQAGGQVVAVRLAREGQAP